MTDDLSARLEGAYSTVFERSLAREAAAALRERDKLLNAFEGAHKLAIALVEQRAERAESELVKANSQAEEFERKWYLCCDEIDRLRALLWKARELIDDIASANECMEFRDQIDVALGDAP